MKKVKYAIKFEKGMSISLSKGNSKLGNNIYNFNLLPGASIISTKDLGPLTNVIGTCQNCGENCEHDCYAVRDTRRHHNVCIPAQAKNTVIMRENLSLMFSQLKSRVIKEKVQILRYHSSGEIESYEYLLQMVKLAKELPQVKFYFYTKRFDFLERYLKEHTAFPDNLVCNVSEWHNNTEKYQLTGLNRFVYDDGADPEVSKLPHCPAVNPKGGKTGITCDKCQRCYSRNDGHRIAVYAH